MVSQSDWLPMTMPISGSATAHSRLREGGDYIRARTPRKTGSRARRRGLGPRRAEPGPAALPWPGKSARAGRGDTGRDAMTEIIGSLDEIDPGYRVLYCDLWGCLHDGVQAFPAAVAALERFRAGGGAVVLLTNSPRPAGDVARQLADARGAALGARTPSSRPGTRRRRRWRRGSSGGGSITSGRSATSASSRTPRAGRSTSSGCRSRRRRASSAPASSTTGARRRTTTARRSSTARPRG